jgi:hypothetical protein
LKHPHGDIIKRKKKKETHEKYLAEEFQDCDDDEI